MARRGHEPLSHSNPVPTVAPRKSAGRALPKGFYPLRLLPQPAGDPILLERPRAVAGRQAGCEVRLALADVSRRHCRFEFAHGVWRVSDLGSLNGIFLNGERILSAELHP